jgi:hypothetical protein
MEATGERWAGWIRFAGILMLIIGSIDFIQGLIAVIRSEYYLFTPNQIIVFDTTTWGWIMMIWGVIVLAGGFGLSTGATWARWFTIVVASLSFLIQLGFVGDAAYPLWALTSLTLTIVVLYAVTIRWDVGSESLRRANESRY